MTLNINWYTYKINSISGYSDELRTIIKEFNKHKNIKQNVFEFYNKRGFIFKNGINIFHTYRFGYLPFNLNNLFIRTMLETDRIPQNWVYTINNSNGAIVPGNFNIETFSKSGVNENRLIKFNSIINTDFIEDDTLYYLDKKAFYFLSVFDYRERIRKGLDVLLKSFKNIVSKYNNVCLILKTNTTKDILLRDYSFLNKNVLNRILIINKVLSRKELMSLYRASDVFVLPSRGEGIGRTLFDAILLNKAVITTGWGGVREFIPNDYNLLIKFRLRFVNQEEYLKYPGFYGSKWAEPNVNDLIDKMSYVIDNKNNLNFNLKKYLFKYNSEIINSFINKISDFELRDINNNVSLNVFRFLFPIYYPYLKDLEDVSLLSKNDFTKKIKKVIILGKKKLNYDFYYILRFNNIDFKLIDVNELNGINFNKYELIIINSKLKNLKDIFYKIINTSQNLPIYTLV